MGVEGQRNRRRDKEREEKVCSASPGTATVMTAVRWATTVELAIPEG